MIKIVKKHVREARKFVREEARRNGVHSCRVDDTLEQISLQKKGLAKENDPAQICLQEEIIDDTSII